MALTLTYGSILAMLTQSEPSKFVAVIAVLLAAALCLKAHPARRTPDPEVSAAA